MYAGSGSLAIEAISRGMVSAVLVEKDRRAQAIISQNISMTKEKERFELLKMESNRALELVTGQFAFQCFKRTPPIFPCNNSHKEYYNKISKECISFSSVITVSQLVFLSNF